MNTYEHLNNLTYDYDKNFRKTFQGKREAWELFVKSVTNAERQRLGYSK